jgi:hypothetical protein
MAHRYQDLISVEMSKTAPGEGVLHAFTWHGVRYPVAEILGSWHPQDKRWDRECAPWHA